MRPCGVQTVMNPSSDVLRSHFNATTMKDNSIMKAVLAGIHNTCAATASLSFTLTRFTVSWQPAKYLLASKHLRHATFALKHQKPTWAEWVDVIVGPEEQIACQLARINFLRGGRGWTEGEPATKEVLLLHGMSCGGFLKRKDRNNSSFQDTGNQSFTPRWLCCFKAT